MLNRRSIRKKLSANDLGLTGAHQAGITIPKDPAILDFFPALDSKQYNPDCYMSLHVPDLHGYVELRFVYYNNKLHGQGTRNEYRLTGTTKLLRELGARVGDYIEFTISKFGENEINLIVADKESVPLNDRVSLSNGWSFIVESEEA